MIEEMLNKPYGANLQGQSKRYICWHFCCEVYKQFGLQLPHNHQQGLSRLIGIQIPVPSIVLFHAVMSWHSGVVWPDGLHFIHACSLNMFDLDPKEFIIKKDRLTTWPWKLLIEGYYASDNTCQHNISPG